MALFKNIVITLKGRALIAKMLAGAKGIDFKRIQTSQDVYTSGQLPDLLGFKTVNQSTLISQITRINDTAIQLNGGMNNTGLTKSYNCNTVGVTAVDPDEGEILFGAAIVDLTAPGNTPDFVPAFNGITSTGLLFDLVVTVDSADSINIQVDPAAFVTVTQFNNHINALDAHDNRFLPLEPYAPLLTIAHGLRCFPTASVAPLRYGVGMGGAGEGPAGGTTPKSVPVSYAWPSENEVALYVPRTVAGLGANPALRRLSDTMYILTWPDNAVDSLLIQLHTDGIEREPRYKLIEIKHGLGWYAIAAVAQLKWGAGMGGAGEIPAGGTPPKSIPVQWEWPSSSVITLYAPKAVVGLGSNPRLHKIDGRQYTVTWPDNSADSLYIRLI